MLVKYSSNSSATIAQIIADLAALAAGATIASLSSGCDKVASAVLANNDPTGWSLIDTAGPSSGKVLTGKDTVNGDKFINLCQYSTTAIYILSYESYNPTTHVGTLPTTVIGTAISFTAGTPMTVYVYATARNLLFMNNLGSIVLGSIEFTREAPHLSNNAYPAHVVCNGWNTGNPFTMIRIKNFGAAGDSTISNAFATGRIGGRELATGNYRDANDMPVVPILDAYAVVTSNGLPLGKFYDTLATFNSAGNFMDTVVIDGVTYFLVPGNGEQLLHLFKFM